MNRMFIKYQFIFAWMLCSLAFGACESDQDFPAAGDLKATVVIAQNLLDTTEEGMEEGDFAPGSQKQLATRIQWANFILDTAENNGALENANKTMLQEIENYKNNTVKAGYPSLANGSEIDLGRNDLYDIRDRFTIEYQVRFKDLSGNNLFSGEDTGGGIITRYANNTIQAYVHNGGWVGGNVNFAFEAGVWYHIAFVYDGQSAVFYVNGKDCMNVKGMKAPVNIKPETHLKFGTHPTYGGRWFSGEVHHVSIWNVAKDAVQVNAEMGKDYAGTENGLLAYWPMNLNLGSTIVDKTGNYTAVGSNITWVDVDK